MEAENKEVWIGEDLTWQKRRIRRKIRQIALREKQSKRGILGIMDRGLWWKWEEEKDLRDGRARSWEVSERAMKEEKKR